MKKTVIAMFLACAITQAQAETYFFTLTDPSASLGAGPYAQIEITQGINANTVNVVETFLSPYYLVNTGGPHAALTWNIAGTETISISGAPIGFDLVSPITQAPFGSFEYGLDCPKSICPHGAPGSLPGPLAFSITSSQALSPSMFVENSGGYWFSSDVINTVTGNTGAAAVVPEPEIYAMLGIGLGLMGWVARRKKLKEAAPA